MNPYQSNTRFAFSFCPISLPAQAHSQSPQHINHFQGQPSSFFLGLTHDRRYSARNFTIAKNKPMRTLKVVFAQWSNDNNKESQDMQGKTVLEKQGNTSNTQEKQSIQLNVENMGQKSAKDAARVIDDDALVTAKPPKPITYQRKTLTFPQLVWDRAKDTFGDAKMHFQRKYFPNKPDGEVKKPLILVLGAGWAGHALIKVIDNEKYDVVCLSPRNYFLFTPMLASTTTGTVEFRSVVEPIRRANEYIDYLEASCVDIDHRKKIAYCKGPYQAENEVFEVPYSFLVVSVGAVTNTFGTPGVREHCYFLKEIEDAKNLRRGIVDRFEAANLPAASEKEKERLLHFIVIGGGPTGCEFAAELNDFLQKDLSQYYPKLIGKVRTTLLQSGGSLLLQFDKSLQDKALENFKKTGIDVITNARVVNVTATTISLKDGRQIEYGLALWAAGNGTSPLVTKMIEKVPEQKNARGRLLVDDWLRVKGMDGVFAIGDCSEVESGPLPATAQVAGQQGAYLGRLLNKDYCLSCELPAKGGSDLQNQVIDATGKNELAKPFQFLSLGILAYIGNDNALAQVEAGESSFNLAGSLTYFLWRSVYLTKQVSMRNRFLVLFDWIRTQLFGRDISNF